MRFTPRAEYRELRAYDAEPAAVAVNLADNTPAHGMSPGVVEALRALAGGDGLDLTRYPTTYSRPLREAIARYVGVAPEEIMVGAGSDEVLSCTFRALASPGQRLAYMHPTFVMTPVFARTNSVVPVAVPLTPSHDVDADALLAQNAELTYLCTPNNPTGVPIAREVVERVVRETRGLVMVDEAYAEFAGTNWAGSAPGSDGLLVYRTFSKAFGLAGARVGFVVGARQLIAELEKARGPYTVSALSERLALAALERDVAWIQARVAETVEMRDEFAAQLREDGFAPLPSAANFVLVPVREAAAAHVTLRARGILVRAFAGLPGIGDALRITIGSRATMASVREGLQACARP
ncbi:MAG: histidinol-phosphate aminotransferase family protein [Gemmatimonadetes bacterium]|nr:histidinol-phosphate aminotransferase family protein [Gemmatimonadota bacterium]